MMFSIEYIYLNVGDIYFKNADLSELMISTVLSLVVFLIGHFILIVNRTLHWNRRLFLLKCVYFILILYISILLTSDALEIWINIFINDGQIIGPNRYDKNLNYSFLLCFIVMILLIVLKNLNIKFKKAENNNE